MYSVCRFSVCILKCNRTQLLVSPRNDGIIQFRRLLSCSSTLEGKNKPSEKVLGKPNLETAKKTYFNFTQKWEGRFEERFPKAHRLYSLVKGGIKTFFSDTKTLYRVSIEMYKGKTQPEFTYRELEVYRQMPTDILKMFPVLAIAALPFAPYIIFPIAYIFPRYLLCRHFWTPEQQTEFGEQYLHHRVRNFPAALECLQEHTHNIKDAALRNRLEDIFNKLAQKGSPTVDQLAEVRTVFGDDQPFGRAFIVSLNRPLAYRTALGLSMAWRSATLHHAWRLHNIDLALIRGGLNSLTPQELEEASFLRGLNAAHCSEADMKRYLETWMHLSKHIDGSTLSLVLHAPVLLAMNHPANCILLKT